MRMSGSQAIGSRRRRLALAVGATAVAAAMLVVPVSAGAATRASAAPALPAWPASPHWEQYVEAPATLNLAPVSVVSVGGTVANPGGIVAGGHGDTTLTRSATDTGPTDIVLDYGRDIGGIPSFTVAAAAGSPTMEAGYSEAQQYIAADGDGGAPALGADGDPSRADSYTVSGPGVITNRYIQGAERYQEISLTSPGSVTLSAVGIRYTAYDGTPGTFKGYFLSSDATLNKEWYDGAYTLNLTQDTAGTQSGQWATEDGAMNLTARTGFISSPTNDGVLKWGGNWQNYTSRRLYASKLDSAAALTDFETPGTPSVDVILDGAKRDRATFTGDLSVAAQTLYDTSTTDRGAVAQDANSAVILYGIAPASRQAGIVAAMTKALSTPAGDLSVSSPVPASSTQIISPFIGSSDVDARFLAGDTAGALQLLTDEWGPMTAGPDGGSMWEKLAADGTIDGGSTSLAHAWSTGPTSALTSYVLGVTLTSPGYATWRIAPQPGDLAWVEGAVPTPHGDITVKWASSQTGFRIAIQTPDRTTGTVVLPPGLTRYSLAVNGRPIPLSPGQIAISVR